MANNDVEIELKFPLYNAEEVVRLLDSKAVGKTRAAFQKDTYFTPKHRNFLDPEYPYEWLRVRETAKSASINYKHFHPENAQVTYYCDEFETRVESAGTAMKILSSLDFREIAVVEKGRSTWTMEEVEIAIDEVKGLGTYIELEALGHFNDPQVARSHLLKVLAGLNARVGSEDFRGYPYLLLEKKKQD